MPTHTSWVSRCSNPSTLQFVLLFESFKNCLSSEQCYLYIFLKCRLRIILSRLRMLLLFLLVVRWISDVRFPLLWWTQREQCFTPPPPSWTRPKLVLRRPAISRLVFGFDNVDCFALMFDALRNLNFLSFSSPFNCCPCSCTCRDNLSVVLLFSKTNEIDKYSFLN